MKLPLGLLVLPFFAACGDDTVEGGTAELTFEGGALDGSEDEALAEQLEELAAQDAESPDAAQLDAELQAKIASYRTLPIDDILADMGLSRDEETQMVELDDYMIRELAIARLRKDTVDPDPGGPPVELEGGALGLRWRHISLDALGEEEFWDAMDALIAGERRFPAEIGELHEQRVELTGYMIPVEYQRTVVTEFMLVRDLLACCFGGAPNPDEWVHVSMEEGRGVPYIPFEPVRVKGRLRIQGIDDGDGYAAGCYWIDGRDAEKAEAH